MRFEQVQRFILAKKYFGVRCTLMTISNYSQNFVISQDLTTLGADGPSGQGNILVSAGVRVLKVPKRRVIELCPMGHMEVFQENFFPRHR